MPVDINGKSHYTSEEFHNVLKLRDLFGEKLTVFRLFCAERIDELNTESRSHDIGIAGAKERDVLRKVIDMLAGDPKDMALTYRSIK